MPIWRLIPIDPLDPNWQASSRRAAVVVRAPDEPSARDAAAAAFSVPVRFSPGEGVKTPPWTRPESVRAEIVVHSIYPAEGPTEILDPSFDQDLPSIP
jgi:hypothetical protein